MGWCHEREIVWKLIEFDFLEKSLIFFNRGVTERLWLGYLKTSSQWDDGTPFSWKNYKDGEPNSQSEMCIAIFTSGQWSGQWFDLPCEDSQYADRGLCQGSGNVNVYLQKCHKDIILSLKIEHFLLIG